MLIRNKSNFHLCAVENVGGRLGSVDYTNESTWMNQPFGKSAGVPNGYTGNSLVMPYQTGGISGLTINTSIVLANGNNGTSVSSSEISATLGGLVNLSGDISALGTLGGIIGGVAYLDGSITILSAVSGDIVSVLNGIGSSITLTTLEGAIVGAVNGIGNSMVSITINADMVGIFESAISIGATSSLGIAVCDGKANAIIGLTVSSTASGTLLAKGYMGGTTEEMSIGLTARDVWEYYQRTLTSGESGGSSYTLEQIAEAVWSKVLP